MRARTSARVRGADDVMGEGTWSVVAMMRPVWSEEDWSRHLVTPIVCEAATWSG